MPAIKPSKEKVQAVIDRYNAAGGPALRGYEPAGKAIGMNRSTLCAYIRDYAPMYGIAVEEPGSKVMFPPLPPAAPRPERDLNKPARDLLRKKPSSLEEIAAALTISKGQALDLVDQLKADGLNVQSDGDRYSIETALEPAFTRSDRFRHVSDAHNRFKFGVVADSHMGSKYERMDALNDIYDRFEREGITHVYHCGNWIEGEARFNRTDTKVHGMGNHIDYLVQGYPKRRGMITYAVTGDDHEGWYAQREGIDIGGYAELQMRKAGREDWVNLGFMEAHVELVNANSGKSAVMAVVHPGGGSAYADSYVVQKIIESLDGGEKPAVALYGHYHKMLSGEYRNVWWVLVPSTKDQDIFMRKKRIRSVVGGGIVELEQDPNTGAITGFTPRLWRYFNRGFYENGRWSHSGDIVLPERTTNPI